MTTGAQAVVAPLPTSQTPNPLPEQTPVKLLSRLRPIAGFEWNTTDSGVLALFDLEELLSHVPENFDVLKQFRYYRSNFKLFVRINTNQFYAGALLVTYWPCVRSYGQYLENRQVLNPVTISAATQQSAEIDINYMYPQEWLNTPTSILSPSTGQQKLYLCFEVLSQLKTSSAAQSDTISVQLFGSFVDPEVMLNRTAPSGLPLGAELQSLEVTKKTGDSTFKSTMKATPATDAASRGANSTPVPFNVVAPTISSIPIIGTLAGSLYDLLRIGTRAVSDLAPTVSALAPLAPLLLDKPDVVSDSTMIVTSAAQDTFCSDIATNTVPVTYSKTNYCKQLKGMGVRLGHWTLAQYAMIPGLAGYVSVFADGDSGTIPFFTSPTPFGYMCSMFERFRGSLRVKLQVFCPAFTSTRIAIYLPSPETAPDLSFDDHIFRIIDVKGDTTVNFTIPFAYYKNWAQEGVNMRFLYRVIAPIIAADASVTPQVDLIWWTSAAPDVQFALPRLHSPTFPGSRPLPEPSSTRIKHIVSKLSPPPAGAEKQSAIGKSFDSDDFTPIVEDCKFILDNAYSISDCPVTFNDLFKRFYKDTSVAFGAPPGATLYVNTDTGVTQTVLQPFNKLFGAIRGGYRIKCRRVAAGDAGLAYPAYVSFIHLSGFNYSTARPVMAGNPPCSDNGWFLLSIPWICDLPFIFRGTLSDPGTDFQYLSLSDTDLLDISVSYRDDLELGLPLFPTSGGEAISKTPFTKPALFSGKGLSTKPSAGLSPSASF